MAKSGPANAWVVSYDITTAKRHRLPIIYKGWILRKPQQSRRVFAASARRSVDALGVLTPPKDALPAQLAPAVSMPSLVFLAPNVRSTFFTVRENIDLDYGAAVWAITIEAVARAANSTVG
jgi:hypothetical protein